MDDKLIINDLPVECVEEILRQLPVCADRNSARLVCKSWWKIMNGVYFPECCYVDLTHVRRTNKQNEIIFNSNRMINFNKLISQFVDFKRKINSYHFNEVDFQNSEQFWEEKGADIKLLQIYGVCENVSFTQIYESCSSLKILMLPDCDPIDVLPDCDTTDVSYTYDQFVNWLKKCIQERKSYSIMHSLHMGYLSMPDMMNIAPLLSQIFPQMQNIYFEDVEHFPNWPQCVDPLITAFRHLNFKKVVFSDISKYRQSKFSLDLSAGENEPLIVAERLTIYASGGYFKKFEFTSKSCRCDFSRLHRLDIDLCHYPMQDELDLYGIVSQSPLLNVLIISIQDELIEEIPEKFILLKHPLGVNNVQSLVLEISPQLFFPVFEWTAVSIDNSFLQSFKHLKSFECTGLFYSDFVKLLRHLDQLEKLSVCECTIDENHDPAVLISHRSLRKLTFSNMFLYQEGTMYKFDNLQEIRVCVSDINAENVPTCLSDLENRIKRIICPKILKLELGLVNNRINAQEDEYVRFISNIRVLPNFSMMEELRIVYYQTNNVEKRTPLVCDEKLKALEEMYPKLQKITVEMNYEYIMED